MSTELIEKKTFYSNALSSVKITPVAAAGAILKKYFNKHNKFTKYMKEVIILLDSDGGKCVKAAKLATQLKEMLNEPERQAASVIVQNEQKTKKEKKEKTNITKNRRTTRSTAKHYQLRSKKILRLK